MAIVIGISTSANDTGAPTSSSSVPQKRWRWIAPLASIAAIDQIPATAEPSDAYRSVSALPPALYMKYASVAFTIGHVAPTPIANGDLETILKWVVHPTQSTRSTLTPG